MLHICVKSNALLADWFVDAGIGNAVGVHAHCDWDGVWQSGVWNSDDLVPQKSLQHD